MVRFDWIGYIVHGPEQISVPSGWAKLGNVFHVHICPMRYLSHDWPLNSAAFMWLSPMLIILFLKNNIFVFFNKFEIIFKLKPSSMNLLIEYNYSNTSWYPFRLHVSISLKKSSNCDKFMQKFLPFHNQWKIWTASMYLILKLYSPKLARNCTMGFCIKSHLHIVGMIIFLVVMSSWIIRNYPYPQNCKILEMLRNVKSACYSLVHGNDTFCFTIYV